MAAGVAAGALRITKRGYLDKISEDMPDPDALLGGAVEGVTNMIKNIGGPKCRWCVLDASGVFSYFKRSEDERTGKPRGHIRLGMQGLHIARAFDDESGTQFSIASQTKTFTFVTRNQDETREWIAALLRARERVLRQQRDSGKLVVGDLSPGGGGGGEERRPSGGLLAGLLGQS